MEVPGDRSGPSKKGKAGTYELTWRCCPTWPMVGLLFLVFLVAATELHDIVVHSLPFVRHRPFADHLLFVYVPAAVTLAVVLSAVFACLANSGRHVTVTLDGVRIYRKGAQGSYSDYLEIPYADIVYDRGGFFPFQWTDIGNTARKERLYALFLPRFGELLATIEEKRGRSRMQDDMASLYLRKRGES